MSDDYSRWKGWSGEKDFARVGRGDLAYFRSELSDAGVPEQGGAVLEIGFGNGEFLGVARQLGWNVTGVELLPDLVAKATSAGFDAIQSDAFDSLPDASYDLIVAFDVLEHIPPDETIRFLTGLRRKLAPTGAIVLRYPNADSDLGAPFQNGDPTHVNAIGWLKLTYYASETGLTIASYRGARRRGFATSVLHGVHRMTAGAYVSLAGAVRRAIYFPALPVVLSNGNVTCTLRPSA